MLRLKYALTIEGEKRCINDEFFLQKSLPNFKGHTEKIFKTLYQNEPKTMREISQITGISRRSVDGIISFNIEAGYIQRIHLY
jgi:DNA-binding MarR family transcriptional regulator